MKSVFKSSMFKMTSGVFGKDIATSIVPSIFFQEWENSFVNAPDYDWLSENKVGDIYETRTMKRFYIATLEAESSALNVENFIIALSMELLNYSSQLGVEFLVTYGYDVFNRWHQAYENNLYLKEWIKGKNGCLPVFNTYVNLGELSNKLIDKDYVRRTFFKSYESNNGTNLVKVWWSEPTKINLECDEEYSEVIKLDTIESVDLGFYRFGYDYTLVESNGLLKCASLIDGSSKEYGSFDSYNGGDSFWSR